MIQFVVGLALNIYDDDDDDKIVSYFFLACLQNCSCALTVLYPMHFGLKNRIFRIFRKNTEN